MFKGRQGESGLRWALNDQCDELMRECGYENITVKIGDTVSTSIEGTAGIDGGYRVSVMYHTFSGCQSKLNQLDQMKQRERKYEE